MFIIDAHISHVSFSFDPTLKTLNGCQSTFRNKCYISVKIIPVISSWNPLKCLKDICCTFITSYFASTEIHIGNRSSLWNWFICKHGTLYTLNIEIDNWWNQIYIFVCFCYFYFIITQSLLFLTRWRCRRMDADPHLKSILLVEIKSVIILFFCQG